MDRPDQLTIRTATVGDAPALALVGAATFLETYAHMIPGPDMLAHCARQHSAETYAAWLADPAATIWLAETQVQSPVGYLVLTRATIPVGAARPDDLEVQRIYVLNRFHSTGVGFALMNLALAKANSKGASRLVLGVHKDNERALAFYKRQGFDVIDDRTFKVGESCFCDFVLARPLR
ncbi:MAG TPA: GNAT family N-acetyltransferase [Acetobacteraceae bacterium]|nr:GNAT family N-acetyltransferase [Acetobacteraceae bacterium]